MKTSFSIMNAVLITWFVLMTSCTREVEPPQSALPIPTELQMAWHEMEIYAFIHFTVNTFTGVGTLGYGDENPEIFKPTAFDAEQWAKTIKEAGLKGLILTCKHHDGFCLWPSKYTEHSVKNSPFMNGKGDVVKAVSDACRKYGLKFGVYLSPWDRSHAQYGTSEYIVYFRNQLQELLTNYGDIFEVWFDGYYGTGVDGLGYYGGANESRKIDPGTYFDWANTWAMVREISPMTVIFNGPDIRWSGNEHGEVGDPNWNTVNADTLLPTHKNPYDDVYNIYFYGEENGTSWLPAEVDVSIRPGWFYDAAEDDQVRTPENLLKIYLESVGRGSPLLLNIPPDRRGLLHENDVKSLMGWKNLLDRTFAVNLAAHAKAKADSYRGKSKKYAAANVTDGNRETYWATDDGVTKGSLEIDLGKMQKVNYVLVQEYIRLGQRVKDFNVEIWEDNAWKQIAKGSAIGYKRILRIDPVDTQKIRINIVDSKACPLISMVEVY